ncbi:unnamed protein product [Ilex paraguariensis]|uniref:Gamma-glutamyl transferase n=1 Tax=Ilex paraguariensis TaxID=185542 RepID=A0ABC8UVN6_9AQUA
MNGLESWVASILSKHDMPDDVFTTIGTLDNLYISSFGSWKDTRYAKNPALKASGPLSIAVPGELAGLHKAWKSYGKLPWKRLVIPAENLARNGFKISPFLYTQMVKTAPQIKADKGLREIFAPGGILLKPGDICRNINLANTLGKISKYGLNILYNGSIGSNIVADVHKAGGILTMEDLQKYQVKLREPISAGIIGLKVLGIPPPSSGGAAMVLILNLLAQYGLPLNVSGPLGIHRHIEALKHAFAMRMNLGDPDFVNVKEVLSDMLSTNFASGLKQTTSDNVTSRASHYGGRWNQIPTQVTSPLLTDQGTTHISIVDRKRNAVSLTTSINFFFGSRFLSPSTGILLNNQMNDFSVPAGNTPAAAAANFILPSKRPLSSMSPTIVLKGERLKAVFGASGGALIIAGTTEVFLNHFANKLDPLSSVLAPRYYHQLIPGVLYYENWTTVTHDHIEVPAKTRIALRKKGHVLRSLARGSVCQFVVQKLGPLKLGELVAVSDPRKGGFPAGF